MLLWAFAVFVGFKQITIFFVPIVAPEPPQSLLDALKAPVESTVVSFQKYLKALIAAVKEDGETIQRLDQEQRLMCEVGIIYVLVAFSLLGNGRLDSPFLLNFCLLFRQNLASLILGSCF